MNSASTKYTPISPNNHNHAKRLMRDLLGHLWLFRAATEYQENVKGIYLMWEYNSNGTFRVYTLAVLQKHQTPSDSSNVI